MYDLMLIILCIQPWQSEISLLIDSDCEDPALEKKTGHPQLKREHSALMSSMSRLIKARTDIELLFPTKELL